MLSRTLATLLLPPFCLILAAIVGVVAWRSRPRLGRALAGTSLALLWLVSTTAFNAPFLEALGWPTPVEPNKAAGVQAIVVLGGGTNRAAAEYGGVDEVNANTLERVRYAAWLYRQTGLPVLASGGFSNGATTTEAELMKAVLEQEFRVPVRWIEARSRNTFENARESARILRDAGIKRIFLVTHSGHIPRALQAFAPTGIEVVPAAMGIYTRDPLTYESFLPGPTGMRTSYYVAHELLGRLWYAIRAQFE